MNKMKNDRALNSGEKLILVGTIIAVISMFMPWSIGMEKNSGFHNGSYLLLILFIIPIYKLLKGEYYNRYLGISLGVVALVLGIIYGQNKDLRGLGTYIYLGSSLVFIIGNFLNKRGPNNIDFTKSKPIEEEVLRDQENKK